VNEVTKSRPDGLAYGSWADIRLIGCRANEQALDGEAPYPLWSDKVARHHPGALLRPTVECHHQNRHEVVSSVLVVLDVRPPLPHDGQVVMSHLAVRLRVLHHGVPVRDPEKKKDPLEERRAKLGTVLADLQNIGCRGVGAIIQQHTSTNAKASNHVSC